jgi:hypothetical protein
MNKGLKKKEGKIRFFGLTPCDLTFLLAAQSSKSMYCLAHGPSRSLSSLLTLSAFMCVNVLMKNNGVRGGCSSSGSACVYTGRRKLGNTSSYRYGSNKMDDVHRCVQNKKY